MDVTERELVRQTLAIIDGDVIRATKRIRDAMNAPMPYGAKWLVEKFLEEANNILVTIPDAKKELYKLLDEQAHDSA